MKYVEKMKFTTAATSNTLINGDCIEIMGNMDANSVDLILVDPPYGTTAHKWDTVLDLPTMWRRVKTVLKPNGLVVFTSSQPFTTTLISSNIEMFQQTLVWNKRFAADFVLSKKRPLTIHEDIVIFGCGIGKTCYNPQTTSREEPIKSGGKIKPSYLTVNGKWDSSSVKKVYTTKLPESIINISNRSEKRGHHPTQKPVGLMEYLIKTYSNSGDTVLDFTMGSGTTGVACVNTGRNFIGIELDSKYYETACNRVFNAVELLKENHD